MSAEVKEMLILSTAYLSEQTAKFLAASDCIDWPALGGPVGGRGWFFEVQADEPPEGVNDYFSDLFGAFRFAAPKLAGQFVFPMTHSPAKTYPLTARMNRAVISTPIEARAFPKMRLRSMRRPGGCLTACSATFRSAAT